VREGDLVFHLALRGRGGEPRFVVLSDVDSIGMESYPSNKGTGQQADE